METIFPIPRLRQAFACLLALIGFNASAYDPAVPGSFDDPQFCGGCHQRIYKEYSQSVMGTDLQNPIVYQFFTATNTKGEKDGMGYQGFFPGQAGDCAQCHVPKLVLKEHKEGREVNLAQAIKDKADFGISCAYCHTVQHVKVVKEGDAITVPAHSLVAMPGGGKAVFVMQEGKAVRSKVETGVEVDGRVRILSGLAAGDALIVGGHENLKEGAAVQVAKSPAPAGEKKPAEAATPAAKAEKS
jgi:hypothetical protein